MAQFVKPLTWILGAVLTLVGIAGFVTGDPLLVFKIDNVHNVVHLLSGLVALGAAATSMKYARWYLIVFGVVYGLVTVLGFVSGTDVLGLFEINTADNYLHLAIAVVSLVVGLGASM